MNKKHLAAILSLVLVFSAVIMISGCNKDDEDTNVSNTGTPEKEIFNEDKSTKETEGTAENETVTEDDKSKATTDNKSNNDEVTTEIESQPPVKVDDTTVEHTSGKNEPVTCDVCGNLLIKDTGKGDVSVGNYCDGNCDEWYGEMELQ